MSRSTRIAFADALIARARLVRAAKRDRAPCRSIFFGGGTPSLMPPAAVAAVLDAASPAVARRGRRRDHARSQSHQRRSGNFRGYRAAGVNRVSVGVQALDDADLKALGPPAHGKRGARRFPPRRAHLPARLLRSDLCAPGPDDRDWRDELARALARAAGPHVALSAHHRAGHRLRRPCRHRRLARSRRGDGRRSLRNHPGADRRRRP